MANSRKVETDILAFLSLCQRGNKEAFNAFIMHTQPMIYSGKQGLEAWQKPARRLCQRRNHVPDRACRQLGSCGDKGRLPIE